MYKKILGYIKKYDSIIITRHKRPDLDALGSQFGLKNLIIENFKNKKVYCVGDMSRPSFLGAMDDINDDFYDNSLLIVTDCSVYDLLPEIPYKRAKEIISIDHHANPCTIERCVQFVDIKAAAACQIIADFSFKMKLNVSKETAKLLYAGIVSDTNRFNFGLTTTLFEVVSNLINTGFDYKNLYDTMYGESVFYHKMKAYFINSFINEDCGLAYIKSDKSIFDKYPVDFFTISRGMVNVMSNLEEVEIWANFTQDPNTDKVVCEFRSKKIPIVDIAIKYGGGGHKLACGATVDSFEVADMILEDFRKLLRSN